MKENIFRYSISIVFLMIAVSLYPATDKKLTSYVNPFIGTGAVASSLLGNNFRELQSLFGIVQLSPDTKNVPDRNE